MASLVSPLAASPGQVAPDLHPDTRPRAFPAWPFQVLAVPIVLRAGLFAVALVTLPWEASPNRIIPAGVQLSQAAFFAAIAGVLLFSGRGDRRAWSLGLFILDAATTLSEPFVQSVASPPAFVAFARNLRTDAFQAALLWFFAGEFPKPARVRWLAMAFRGTTGVAVTLGVALASLDLLAVLSNGATGTPFLDVASVARRQSPTGQDWYFSAQFLLLTPLLVLLPLKLREGGPDDRRRFVWLVAGLAIGVTPLIVSALGTLSEPVAEIVRTHFRLFGLFFALALMLVPVSAAYAALVQRTLDLRLVLRAALQYVFARSGVTVLAGLPLLWLAVIVFANRDQSVDALITGPEGRVLGVLAVLGVAAALARARVLSAIDRAFFREELDARQTLLALVDSARHATTLAELSASTSAALTNSLHPSSTCVFVAGEDAFHAQDADLPPLLRASPLAQLVEGGDMPFTVDRSAGAVVERLSPTEREWLAAARAHLLLPMRGMSGQLLGILALGEKRSELPYSADDRTLLSAAGSAGGVALERILSAERQGSTPNNPLGIARAARECVECGTVLEPDARACSCGGLLQRAPVPFELDDRFRFLQRVGVGGMGVVYRTLDLRLQQIRAAKTLAGTTEPAMVSRLRREARAMAAVTHANLATLYGLEMWRGVPILVMEYLDGGTLADRLKRGPLPADAVLALGVTLSEAVVALHAAGILHRDIKPSNIGFTGDGVPKLLDFGLAKLQAKPTSSLTAAAGNDSTLSVSVAISTDAGIRGTPAYLSPDVLSGEPPSPADDIWSLSVTLLEAQTGENPFKASSVPTTVGRVLAGAEHARRHVEGVTPRLAAVLTDVLLSTRTSEISAREFTRMMRAAQMEG